MAIKRYFKPLKLTTSLISLDCGMKVIIKLTSRKKQKYHSYMYMYTYKVVQILNLGDEHIDDIQIDPYFFEGSQWYYNCKPISSKQVKAFKVLYGQ